jgi:hypothetical protein
MARGSLAATDGHIGQKYDRRSPATQTVLPAAGMPRNMDAAGYLVDRSPAVGQNFSGGRSPPHACLAL